MKHENQVYKACSILHIRRRSGSLSKSNSRRGVRPATTIATAIAALMLTACSDGNGTISFRSSDEAIREYHGFLSGLQQTDKVSIQSLAKSVNEWRVLHDSVTSCLARDTATVSHSNPYAAYREVNDSIHNELYRMALSKQRTFRDLLYLLENRPLPMPVMANCNKP